LYCDAALAYEALPPDLKDQLAGLQGLHAVAGTGRTEREVQTNQALLPLSPQLVSQRQPVVRVHPVTGKPAVYICDGEQMDWHHGPLVGMEPGPGGNGAALLYEILTHVTQPAFVYVHDWEQGDLVICDNRNVIHAASWFDGSKVTRIMWRTTVTGNPGREYEGDRPSWL